MSDITANLGLSSDTIATVDALLRRLLANSFVLQVKIKQFHWNIRGAHFIEYHKFFDDIAGALDPVIDDTAERIRSLGIDAPGTMQQFIDEATLKEHMPTPLSDKKMMSMLLSDYETLIQELRNDISTCVEAGDDGNADFLTALMEQFEKTAWMLRATVS